MKRNAKNHWTVRGAVTRAVLLVILLLAGIGLYLARQGCPPWLSEWMLAHASRGSYVIRAESIRWKPYRQIELDNIEIYKKGLVGPPGMEAARCAVDVSFWSWLKGLSPVRKVTVENGTVRPPLLLRRGTPQPRRVGRPSAFTFEATGLRVAELPVNRMRCEAVSDGWVTRLERLAVDVEGERRVTGSLGYSKVDRVLTGDLAARMNPRGLLSIVDRFDLDFLGRLIRRFEFSSTVPRWDMTFSRGFRDHTLSLDMDFWAADCAYRGVALVRTDGHARLRLSPDRRTVRVSPLLVVREEGHARGHFTVNGDAGEVSFEGVSDMDPKALAGLIGVGDSPFLERLSFDGHVRITAAGRASYRVRNDAEFSGTMVGNGIGIGKFVTDSCRCNFRVSGPTNTLADITGRMYGGALRGRVEVVWPEGNRTNVLYRVDGAVHRADFEQVTARLMGLTNQNYRGSLSVSGSVQGLAGKGQAGTAAGKGTVRVSNGRVFLLPVFGGFSRMMTRIIPGLDFMLRQTDAQADLVVRDSRVHAEKVDIAGDVLSLSGDGDLFFDKRLEFTVQVTLMKEHTLVARVVRALTYPISKFFEFRLHGTVQDPLWEPFRFPSQLLEKLGLKSSTDAEE